MTIGARVRIRRLIGGSLLAASMAVGCTGPGATASPTVQAGILIVAPGEQVQARPPSEELAVALSRAMELADANGHDLGYPWIDPASGELVLSVVTQHGREIVEAAGITVPHRVRAVTHGAAELRSIQDDVTFLHSRGVVGSELIYATAPDQRDNRALIVIRAANAALLEYLAATYAADALAVMVDPSGMGGAQGAVP